MINRFILSFFTSVVFVLICPLWSCQPDEVTYGEGAPLLIGTWRLIERADVRDTTYTIKSVPPVPEQTITFTDGGGVSTQGKEMEYYRAAKFYRLENSQPAPVVRFYINEQHANFSQPVSVRGDTLELLPPCERRCYLRFIRSR